MSAVLHVHEKDNVVTCLRAMKKGERFEAGGETVTVVDDTAIFHKLAIADIPKGQICYKYGSVIGVAVSDIAKGMHVHVHNLESTRGRGDKKSVQEGK